MRHRLADVVEEGSAARGLDRGSELRRHDAGEVDNLERVLEDVLAIARAVAESSEDLDELLVELAAVRLEHRLLAGEPDVILELGLREVVHLLDASRMNAPVLDQLLEGEARYLPAEAVERR